MRLLGTAKCSETSAIILGQQALIRLFSGLSLHPGKPKKGQDSTLRLHLASQTFTVGKWCKAPLSGFGVGLGVSDALCVHLPAPLALPLLSASTILRQQSDHSPGRATSHKVGWMEVERAAHL